MPAMSTGQRNRDIITSVQKGEGYIPCLPHPRKAKSNGSGEDLSSLEKNYLFSSR